MSNQINCESCGNLFQIIKGRGFHNRITCYSCTNGNRKITWRNKHLKRTYGITLYQARQMFEKQNGKCLICTSDISFDNVNTKAGEKRDGNGMVVDHCHKTGVVRGLLCFHCNTALGHLFDDPIRMQRMINYVRSEGMD